MDVQLQQAAAAPGAGGQSSSSRQYSMRRRTLVTWATSTCSDGEHGGEWTKGAAEWSEEQLGVVCLFSTNCGTLGQQKGLLTWLGWYWNHACIMQATSEVTEDDDLSTVRTAHQRRLAATRTGGCFHLLVFPQRQSQLAPCFLNPPRLRRHEPLGTGGT